MSKKSYDMYLKKLNIDVADGVTMLFEWYRRIGNAHINGKLTKSEFKKLLDKGKDFEY